MVPSDQSLTKNEMGDLREGIKNKYRHYHLTDPIQFPDFEYNTNRANYDPLRTSFEKEFYVVRGIDRINPNIHIPSTNTLSLIFTDDSYVPGKKILNNCRLYAEGQVVTPTPVSSTEISTTNPKAPKRAVTVLLMGLVVLIVGSYLFSQYRYHTQKASELIIGPPINPEEVSRLLPIEGRVANADTVWVVVRPAGSPDYYVQAPVKVDSSGHWRGFVIIGSTHKANSGLKFQIRAFAKPEQPIVLGDVLQQWPEAESTSRTVEVVRGDEIHASPTDDISIYTPFDGQTVPCEVPIKGKAVNADTIWVVIRPESNRNFWVQSPIKVQKNGEWEGKVYVGEPGTADVGWLYKIRAFVKPVEQLKYDDILYNWPKAERSSGVLDVIRGPKDK